MSTSSTKQDTATAADRTTPFAMHAVAKHGLDQRLPAPQAIRRPRVGSRAIRIGLFVDDLEAWVQATGADYLSTETIGEHARSVVVKFAGRVPTAVGDVEVELAIVQRVSDWAPGRLSLVPSDGVA